MRKGATRLFLVGMLGAIAYAAWRAWRARVPRASSDIEWTTAPFPFPPVPRPPAPTPAPAPDEQSWVEPDNGACPASHPVKAKLSSGIFHVPGGANYERTHADRCYLDESAATNDGLRRSKV